WTLAILVLRLRQPRPRLHRLACQPGAIACYSAAFALVPALIGLLCMASIENTNSDSPLWEMTFQVSFILVPALTGFAVLGSWANVGRPSRAGSIGREEPWVCFGSARSSFLSGDSVSHRWSRKGPIRKDEYASVNDSNASGRDCGAPECSTCTLGAARIAAD